MRIGIMDVTMLTSAIDTSNKTETFESENDYIRRMEAQSDIMFFKTNDMTYEYTSETFTKTSRLPVEMQRRDGTRFVWYRSWNHERITNEAKALELVARQTSVPVPHLLDYGTYSDGRRYLKTKFITGSRLDTFPLRTCSKPGGQRHTSGTPCKECSNEAYQNALEFITNTVLPQFASMRSHTRGIDGFVMPPSWLCPDIQPPWVGKETWKTLPSKRLEYTFQHGDIAAQNIIIDPQTLKVKSIIDFEYAGFYPPGMENWPGTLCADVYNRRADNVVQLIKRFLATEYEECYDKWSDKDELHELVKLGRLPAIDRLRQGATED